MGFMTMIESSTSGRLRYLRHQCSRTVRIPDPEGVLRRKLWYGHEFRTYIGSMLCYNGMPATLSSLFNTLTFQDNPIYSSPVPGAPPPPACLAAFALQISSTLKSKHADSIAVLILCNLTASGSQTPYSFISTSFPVSPSIPHVLPPSACLALKAVRTLTGLAPAF